MIVLGIDPGSVRLGFGVVEKTNGKVCYKASGLLEITQTKNKGAQLLSLYRNLRGLLTKYRPNFIGIETLFFTINKKTALDVSEARGVILLAIAERRAPYFEFTPTSVKSLLTGDGKATKEMVAKVVRLVLEGEPRKKTVDDELDALAVAIITSQTMKFSA